MLEEWRIEDEWWRSPLSRRYCALILEGGNALTLYRDETGPDRGSGSGRWFIHGGP